MSFRNRNNFLNTEYSYNDYGQIVRKNVNISGTFTGSVFPEQGGESTTTGSYNGNFTGSFTGSFSGSFTGSFSGTVVGGIAGDGAANQLAYFNTSAYITSSAAFKRDSTGNLTVSASVNIQTNQNNAFGAASNDGALYVKNINGGNTSTVLTFVPDAGSNFNVGIYSSVPTAGSPANSAFFTQRNNAPMLFSTNNTERMRLLGGGELAIGSATASFKLDVVGSASVTVDKVSSFGASTNDSAMYIRNVNAGNTSTCLTLAPNAGSNFNIGVFSSVASPANAVFLSNRNAAPMLFYTNATERIRISGTGEVSIGLTQSAGESLTISGGLAFLEKLTDPSISAGYAKLYVKSTNSRLYFLDDTTTTAYGIQPFGVSGSIQYMSGNLFSSSANFRWMDDAREFRITGSDNPTFGAPNVSLGAQAPKLQLDDKNNSFSTPADWTVAPGLDLTVKTVSADQYGQGIKWVSNRAAITPLFVAGIFPRALEGYDGAQSTTALDFYLNRANSARFNMTIGEPAGGVLNLPSLQIGGLINDDAHDGILNVKARSSGLTTKTNYPLIRIASHTTNSANKTDLGMGISFAQNSPGSSETELAGITGQVSTWGGTSSGDLSTTAIAFHTIFSGNVPQSGIVTECARFVGNTLHIGLTGSLLEKTGSMRLVVSGVMAYAQTSSSPAAANDFGLLYVKNDSYLYYRASKNGNLAGFEYNLNAVYLSQSIVVQSGSQKTPLVSVNSLYTASLGDNFIKALSSGSELIVVLPTAIGKPGLEYTVKRVGTNEVVLSGTNSQTIDGELGYAIAVNSGSVTVISDDVGWLIKSKY
jgi:hypothetical protein